MGTGMGEEQSDARVTRQGAEKPRGTEGVEMDGELWGGSGVGITRRRAMGRMRQDVEEQGDENRPSTRHREAG